MEDLHGDMAKYRTFMKITLSWYGDDSWGESIFGRTLAFYFKIRWLSNTAIFCTVTVNLYFQEKMGLYEGTFVHWPLSILLCFMTIFARFSGSKQRILTLALNENFLKHDDPWMIEIKNGYIPKLWQLMNFFLRYNQCFYVLYAIVPPAVEMVLHYGFDSIDGYVTLPLPLSPLLGRNATWETKYQIVSALNVWAGYEIVFTTLGFIGGYALLTVFYLTEIIIFKEKIKSVDLERSYDDIKVEMRHVIASHNNIIKLNQDLKAFYGLPCAFLDIFSSVTITLTLFTVTTSNDIPIVIAYGAAMFYFFTIAILACSLGQLIERESEEVFEAFYELPWYECSPQVRKDLNMVMRQARSTLSVDYRGMCPMNLVNLMQILKSSYSYFTLLQTMAN
ncbi:7tm Odorant receptor [Nesidiocoris tenuis]|uniref:Odorant receptor n=1 Tax=Nesidiocoris tenuis TaxID=355587 RepID=A0ABN7BCP0_9HEMI|nr:7tm Odorant receptor [Nesidiocoris tenuis]